MDTAAEVNHAADALIATVNASLRLSDLATQPLTVGPVVDAQGARTHFAIAEGTVSARARVSARCRGQEGRNQPAPLTEPEQSKRTRLIGPDAEVARAVKFLSEPDETFGSLWKALEIVLDDLGHGNLKKGAGEAVRLYEVNADDLTDFRENANDPTLSGDLARHAGKNKVRNPKTTRRMDRADAEALVRRVVLAWIDGKR